MNTITSGHSFNTVGCSVIRPDAIEKVTGQARYIADLVRVGMLHAVTVRSPWAYMTDLEIDPSLALKMPGVVCIATADDIPGLNQVPLVFQDQPFLAHRNVNFHGEAVALVAAETLNQAIRAAQAVIVNGNKLPPCIDPLEALSGQSPQIYGTDNVFRSYHIERGDLENAFARTDVIVDQSYRTPHQEHAYLETQGILAEWDDSGGLQIMGSMQCPFYVQDAVSAILGMPKHRITVIQTATGGGFGGKEDVPSNIAGHAALLAYLTRRPVRLILNREEDFRSMSKRHPSITQVRIGATRDGHLMAADIKYILNGGAYATLSPIVLWRGTVHAAGPYTWNAVRIASLAVATHTVPNGAFRGFGQPQVAFAIESAIDELAARLEIDPLELRRRNIIGIGDQTATGHIIDNSCGMADALEKGAIEIQWESRRKPSPVHIPDKWTSPVRGVGCALSFYGVGLGAGGKYLARAGAYVQVEDDGSVRIFIGNTEMGQGARSVIGQIAAETLNAPFDAIHVHHADTSRVPDSGPTVASRTTVMSGGAVMDACRQIRKSLQQGAAELLGCASADVGAVNTMFHDITSRSQGFAYLDVVRKTKALRLPLVASGWFVSPDTSFGENGQGNPYMTYVWSANFVEVEVDPGTLEIKVIKLVAAHDVGKAINPREVAGQIRGGALQGIGFAIMEDLHLDQNGKMLNPGLSGYLVPTAADAPDIIPIIIENPFPQGPFGAKGIGEPPLIAVAPAIANAVENALGVRVRELPLCAENILKTIRNMGVLT